MRGGGECLDAFLSHFFFVTDDEFLPKWNAEVTSSFKQHTNDLVTRGN